MKTEKLIEKLKRLVSTPAVSGYEWELGIPYVIEQLIGEKGKRIGDNLIYTFGSGNKKILVSAHMDEVGFFITNTLNNCYRIMPIGSIGIRKVVGEKLVFYDKQHIYTSRNIEKADSFSDLKVSVNFPLYIGTVGTFEKKITCKKDTITAPSLDNKVGCLVLIELISLLLTKEINTQYTYVICFACREEIGAKGLMTAVKYFNPTLCIDVDSAYARPLKGKDKKNWSIPKLGKGPALQLYGKGFIISSRWVRLIEHVARELQILLQYEIPPGTEGGTNANTLLACGYDVMQINIPVAEQHSGKSKSNISDIKQTIKLLEKTLEKVIEMI